MNQNMILSLAQAFNYICEQNETQKKVLTGPNPIKLFSASIYPTLKRQPIREAQRGRVTTLIGQNFSVASIEAEKSFIGLGPGGKTK